MDITEYKMEAQRGRFALWSAQAGSLWQVTDRHAPIQQSWIKDEHAARRDYENRIDARFAR